ncbi:phage virion morphogenesis protein [Flavisphingomonas formosensis]|uniref:phage virion morphogenesis protein n=1 Tax=Flavisphingomonas formosensis TaxID=861534 RepID=UPI0012F8C7D9|nr:phage virion morphogenesis protein [Sphingomonas formosensis]
MEADDLQPLEQAIGALIEQLAPVKRRAIARKIGQGLRRRTVERIAGQVNPDGSPFEPRKLREAAPRDRAPLRGKAGRIKRREKARAMFVKLWRASWLKVEATVEQVGIGFVGTAARIAAVHQLGLHDRVSKEPGAPEVTYPVRQLLGLTEEDRAWILEEVFNLVDAAPRVA